MNIKTLFSLICSSVWRLAPSTVTQQQSGSLLSCGSTPTLISTRHWPRPLETSTDNLCPTSSVSCAQRFVISYILRGALKRRWRFTSTIFDMNNFRYCDLYHEQDLLECIILIWMWGLSTEVSVLTASIGALCPVMPLCTSRGDSLNGLSISAEINFQLC